MKRTLAFLLAFVMVAMALVGCNPKKGNGDDTGDVGGKNPNGSVEITEFDPNAKYTYKAAVSTVPTGWNPHTYQTADDAVYFDYTTDSLYTLFFNDEIHPQEGREAFEGYVIVPSMAADFPVDVTEAVKASHPQFNIPESATSGYAWEVTLRDGLKWQDGTPITAQDFVDSLERVLRPELINFRATDYDHGTYAVVNAEAYSHSGRYVLGEFVSAALGDDEYVDPADFTVSENGTYQVDGQDVVIDLTSGGNWGDSLLDYYNTKDAEKEEDRMPEAIINAIGALIEKADANNWVYINAETIKMVQDVIAMLHGAPNVEAYAAAPGVGDYAYQEFEEMAFLGKTWDTASFDDVGLFADGNKLTFVFANALDGFYLMTYGMSTSYLVKTDVYDKSLKPTESASGTAWSSTYGTDLDTSVSYGPYVLTEYQNGKSMHFSKNENWWGWTSDVYTYVDPDNGKCYRMYQTTDVDLQYVKEAATQKQMFLNGQLMTYGLQSNDYDDYRNSDYYYATPAETIYFLLFNGYESVINDREAAADFDKNARDLQTQMLESFRRGCAVSIDREDMAKTVSPARQGGYAFIGNTYIYDPETCAYYRDTDQAKQALVNFYSINLADYDNDLDKAVDAITGYDPETAKAKFAEAYQEALAKGYITDADNDGKSDQTVTMYYAGSGEINEFFSKTIDYLNTSLNNGAKGTGLEGKIEIVYENAGENEWNNKLRSGLLDTQLAGWSGAVLDPFSMADTWTDSSAAYWGAWYDATKHDMELTIDGEKITMSLRDWALCLNGTMTKVGDKEYNFGYGQTTVENRLTILAAIEEQMLTAYNCVPILQNGSGALLSKQVYYIVEDYNPMMGRGGIQYMKYNFSDTEWETYVQEQGGTLAY